MLLNSWKFLTIMLVAFSMGMAFCHLLEMPVRLTYAPELWSRVTNVENTYRFFGSRFGAFLEVGAVVAAIGLMIFSRKEKRAILLLTILAAICMVAAQVVWWVFVFPVNQQMIDWTPENLPSSFAELRNRWEYAHAGRALLQIVSLAAVAISVLVQRIPTEAQAEA